MEVKIIDLGVNGEGVGTLDQLKVFVNDVLPGEKVEVQLTETKRNYAKGKALSIVQSSPERVTPICPLAGECGGCQIMHLSYQGQLEIKRKRVQAALERIGHFKNITVEPCVPSPKPLGYRNKIQMPMVGSHFGFYRKGSHDVVAVDRCHLHCPSGEEVLDVIKSLNIKDLRYLLLKTAEASRETLVIFVTDGIPRPFLKQAAEKLLTLCPHVKGVVENINPDARNAILGPTWKVLAGRPYIFETLLGKTFKISAGAFFQVNPCQAEQLYTAALNHADVANKKVLDAYCGVGTLSIFAAATAKEVMGIELVQSAIIDARENAELNGLHNCRFRHGSVEKLIPSLPSFDVVFLNPPRKGCDVSVLDALIQKPVQRLIYISCDPATLARDLAHLCQHRYSLQTVQPFDMFPQTMHVETLAVLDAS